VDDDVVVPRAGLVFIQQDVDVAQVRSEPRDRAGFLVEDPVAEVNRRRGGVGGDVLVRDGGLDLQMEQDALLHRLHVSRHFGGAAGGTGGNAGGNGTITLDSHGGGFRELRIETRVTAPSGAVAVQFR
jgi:hypothetical protein